MILIVSGHMINCTGIGLMYYQNEDIRFETRDGLMFLILGFPAR